jgi:hypothetical protein
MKKKGYFRSQKIYNIYFICELSELVATDPEDPGSIPGATTFSEK